MQLDPIVQMQSQIQQMQMQMQQQDQASSHREMMLARQLEQQRQLHQVQLNALSGMKPDPLQQPPSSATKFKPENAGSLHRADNHPAEEEEESQRSGEQRA